MAVDMHAHYIPEELALELRRRPTPPKITREADGRETLHIPRETLLFRSEYTDMDARLRFMDEVGVRCQVLSLPGLFGVDSLPYEESAGLTRIFNNDLSQLCRRFPDRFLGLASLPFADMEKATEEFQRSRTELGLIGAILPGNFFVNRSEAEKLRSLFEVGQGLGAHFFVHPGSRPDEVLSSREPETKTETPGDTLVRLALKVQADIAHSMATLLFSDFLEDFANVTVHVANLGGTLPMVIERMDHMSIRREPNAALPSSLIGRVSVDCASLGSRSIELAVAVYGAERVLMGTDYPVFGTRWTLDAIRDARMTRGEREAILEGNADRLLQKLLTSSP